jgi:hypothetical protein
VAPVLQAQDGWFVGSVSGDDGQRMVAFDHSGGVRWVVAGYTPQIALADGGVIATDDSGMAVAFGQNGGTTQMMGNLRVQSWPGNSYQIGTVEQVVAIAYTVAASFWAFEGANNSSNNAAVGSVATTLVITRDFDRWPADCYSSLGSSGGSYAERRIMYHVEDQYRRKMLNGMQIQERLQPTAGTPCPTGTSLQNGLCVGAPVTNYFLDTLSANPQTGHSEFTQMFWVATPENMPGYEAFYGQIQRIDAYQPPGPQMR